MFRRLVVSRISEFESWGYFQEQLGIDCVDGFIAGSAGDDVGDYVFSRTRKDHLFPFSKESAESWEVDDVFDVIEFVFDHVSMPIGDGKFHSYGECGNHYDQFDDTGLAQEAFRNAVNEFLPDYGVGYELGEEGEILQSIRSEFAPLHAAGVPSSTDVQVIEKIQSATRKYRARHSSNEDKLDAVRDLADALEFIRPSVKKVIARKDEAALFEIANKFGIRHHTPRQQTQYDKNIWHRWMFYFYLSTLHAALRMIARKERES